MPVNIDDIGQRLKRKERNTDGHDDMQYRKIGMQKCVYIFDEKIVILEIPQSSQVPKDT
jgi:hypothetical protein